MADGQSGNGGSAIAIFDQADLKELNVQIRGLNISVINLTNAINRFTMSTVSMVKDRSQIDREILDGIEEIKQHIRKVAP